MTQTVYKCPCGPPSSLGCMYPSCREGQRNPPIYEDTPSIEGLIKRARQEEREACAKLCEAYHTLIAESLDGYDIAAAIRARGEGKA